MQFTRIGTGWLFACLVACSTETQVLETIPPAGDLGGGGAPSAGSPPVAAPSTGDPGGKVPGSSNAALTARTIVAGGVHTCGRRSDGTLSCWGYNVSGQLGLGVDTWISAKSGGTDFRVVAPLSVPELDKIVEVTLGSDHTCARSTGGDAWCWGGNAAGEVGVAPSALQESGAQLTPWFIADLRGNVAQIAAGRNHTCAALKDGTVKCWGTNGSGELGVPELTAQGGVRFSSTPLAVNGLTGVVQIGLGYGVTYARLTDGTVSQWGYIWETSAGQAKMVKRDTPVPVPGLAGVVEIAVGASHACARLANGTVSCWGENANGQLGDGSVAARSTPAVVPDLANVTSLALGNGHSCATLSDGTVSCWGRNDFGQLGDGSTTKKLRPTAVPQLASVKEIAAGFAHTCALDAKNQAFCWGRGIEGQLGNNAATDRPSPVLTAW
jgi:alpha-tubulin suppressor-like RCC1 family protein